MAIRCFLTFLAEQKHFVVEEEMSLHGFEACQVLHFTVTFLMVCPNIKRPLHEQFSQIIQIALKSRIGLKLAQFFAGAHHVKNDLQILYLFNMQIIVMHII